MSENEVTQVATNTPEPDPAENTEAYGILGAGYSGIGTGVKESSAKDEKSEAQESDTQTSTEEKVDEGSNEGNEDVLEKRLKDAQRKMHETTTELSRLKKVLEEKGFVYEDGDIRPVEKKEEEKPEINEEEYFLENPSEYIKNKTLSIIQAVNLQNSIANEYKTRWQSRPDYEIIRENLAKAIQEYSDYMPTETEFVQNPRNASVKAQKFFNMVERVALGSLTPEQIQKIQEMAEAEGRAKAEMEQKNQKLVAGLTTGKTRPATKQSEDKQPEDEIKEGILAAGGYKSIFS